MPSLRMRTSTCRSLALILLSLAACRISAFASPGEGAAAAAADSAFVPPASTTTRSWFGGIHSTKPSAPTDNTASISARPTSAFASSTKLGVRTWVPATGASRATSARREAMAMDAVGESNAAPKIIIAGAPASGKGTQCSLIKERYGVVHLSTGGALVVLTLCDHVPDTRA